MSGSVVIVGAGLAGLSCAKHSGVPCVLFERSSEVGGVARSFEREGFIFDITGHWLHLQDQSMRALVQELLGDEALMCIHRRADIWSQGVRTPYPFQANTYGLPSEVVVDCVLGYFEAREKLAVGAFDAPKNFEDFIRQRMGDGIADHFMLPYNRKIWTVPPQEMAYQWTDRFVPLPTPQEVVRGALQPAGAGHALGYNAQFLYPQEGGIGRMAAALADSLECPLNLDRALLALDWKKKSARFEGHELRYRCLVSTMPLNALLRLLVDPPDEVAVAASRLRAASVTYWDLGFKGANGPHDPHWTYVPNPALPFYRVGSPSAVAPHLAPPGHRSYYVEVSHAQGTPCPVSDTHVLSGLREMGVIAEGEEPVLCVRSSIPCAYVIMDHAYGEARDFLLDWLRSQDILSIGRYGAWTYDSMEGAMIQGRDAATEIRERMA